MIKLKHSAWCSYATAWRAVEDSCKHGMHACHKCSPCDCGKSGPVHAKDGTYCWCNPELKQPCLECWDLKAPRADCWSCGGKGLVDVYDDKADVVVIHREAPDEA